MSGPEARLHELGGAGPDLLLIHGYGSDRLSWPANAPAFFGQRRVWAVDLPGHGAAPAEVGDGTPAALAGAVAEVVERLERPFDLVGHSLGGAVAVELATLLPGAVRSLVLIAPAGLGHGVDAGFVKEFPSVEDQISAYRQLLRLVEKQRLIAPAMAAHVLAGLKRPGRREALERIGAALGGLDPLDLPEGVPHRVIWGDADRINPHDPARAAALGPRFTLLEGVGHLPQIEAASRVNKLISEGFSE